MKKTFTYKQRIIRTMPHSVIRVLIENKCLNEYIGYSQYAYKIRGNAYSEFLSSHHPSSWIIHSFIWNHTKEGYNFWWEIAKQVSKISIKQKT